MGYVKNYIAHRNRSNGTGKIRHQISANRAEKKMITAIINNGGIFYKEKDDFKIRLGGGTLTVSKYYFYNPPTIGLSWCGWATAPFYEG